MICSLLVVLLQGLVTGRNVSPYINYRSPDLTEATQSLANCHQDVPVLVFPKSSGGLRRRKRDWVIPPISVPENEKGPFPKQLTVQIKSSLAKETSVWYSITGEGADQPPKGLFTVDRNSGWLYATMPLDREKKDQYSLLAHAVSQDGRVKEDPMEIIIYVTDQNDNKPIFTQDPFHGSVPEASNIGFEVMTVTATDADDPNTYNGEITYSIIGQIPALPYPKMFTINPVVGVIQVDDQRLDRENYPEYTLDIQAADSQGNGFTATAKAIITVTDSNDNAPQFEKNSYNVSVPENKVRVLVVKLPVTDEDEPQSPAWAAKFRIVSGNTGGGFNVTTGTNQQEGIITTVKPLDFERQSKYILMVIAENEVQFVKPLSTSTTTITVNVIDVNEAPVFDPERKIIHIPEDLKVDSDPTVYIANDTDTAKSQKVTYCVGTDPAGWLNVDKETGVIKVKSPMDRESPLVKDGKYEALILAMDDDPISATGTGTLEINLQDVNDNGPIIEERSFRVCNRQPAPVLLSVTDKDGPTNAAPYSVQLMGDSHRNWTAKMNETRTGIILTLTTPLEQGEYNVVLRVFDIHNLAQENTVQASVCDCTGHEVMCARIGEAGFGLSAILGILGAILALLLLVLLLLLFLRKKRLRSDEIPVNIHRYTQEDGGNDDQVQ